MVQIDRKLALPIDGNRIAMHGLGENIVSRFIDDIKGLGIGR
jgi:hypothetical protein